MNEDLREQAKQSIANYMHHELFEITGDTKMLPWLVAQGEAFMQMIDRGVAAAMSHPMADEVKMMRRKKP